MTAYFFIGYTVGIVLGYVIWAPETRFKKNFVDGMTLRFCGGRNETPPVLRHALQGPQVFVRLQQLYRHPVSWSRAVLRETVEGKGQAD